MLGPSKKIDFNLWLLMAGTLILCVLNARNIVFMDPDEARCAIIARQMLTTGDWLVPRVPCTTEPYFDKPILYFWMLAGAFRVFGVNEFSARLLASLGAALVVGATYRLGRIVLSPRAGLAAALMLATSVMVVVGGRFVRMDIWLTAFASWAIVFWAKVQFEHAPRRNLAYGYACLAAAFLTKGLIGILLPFAAVGLYLVLHRDWRSLQRSNIPLGLLLIAVLAGPWYGYMESRCPGYLMDFFWRHHFLRATTKTFGRSEVVLFLPGVALAGFIPWTFLLVGGIARSLPLRINVDWPKPPGISIIFAWAAVGILPFAVFGTQLPVYVMPAFPALALIAGWFVDELLKRNQRWELRLVLGVTCSLMAMSLVALAIINRCTFCDSPWWTLVGRLAGFVVILVLVVRFFRHNRMRAVITTLVASTVAFVAGAAWTEGPAMSGHFSSQRFVRPLADQAQGAELLVIGPAPRYALPFYLKRPIEIRFVEHIIDLLDYTHYPRRAAALLTGNGLIDLARGQLGRRLRVLDQHGDTYLATIDPPGAATPRETPHAGGVRPSAAPASTEATCPAE